VQDHAEPASGDLEDGGRSQRSGKTICRIQRNDPRSILWATFNRKKKLFISKAFNAIRLGMHGKKPRSLRAGRQIGLQKVVIHNQLDHAQQLRLFSLHVDHEDLW
jgi:hypothetical protein